MGLVDKYPYTNFAGINLDYYIKMVNAAAAEIEDIKTEIEAIKNYVKDVAVINSNAVKVTYGNNTSKTYAIPSGTNFVLDVIQPDEDTTLIDDLEVNASEEYDTNLTNYSVFADALYTGVPCILRAITYLDTVIGIANIQANWQPSIIIWDSVNSAWKVFTVAVGTNCKATVTRVY